MYWDPEKCTYVPVESSGAADSDAKPTSATATETSGEDSQAVNAASNQAADATESTVSSSKSAAKPVVKTAAQIAKVRYCIVLELNSRRKETKSKNSTEKSVNL